MKMRTTAVAATLALSLAAISAPASAAVTMVWDSPYGSTGNTGASASGLFTFSDVSGNVLIDLVLTNTTDGVGGLGASSATLVGVAFDLPTFTSVTFDAAGTTFTKFWTNVDAQPYGPFDVGASTPRNTFNGGNANSGLVALSTLGAIKFNVNTTLNAADFEAAFLAGHLVNGGLGATARFQQVNAGGGSDKVLGNIPPPPIVPPTAVPEPATWAMMLIGFFGLGGALRASRRRTAATA